MGICTYLRGSDLDTRLFAVFDWIATSSIYSLFWTVVSNLNFLSENMSSFILRIYIKTDQKLMEDLD